MNKKTSEETVWAMIAAQVAQMQSYMKLIGAETLVARRQAMGDPKRRIKPGDMFHLDKAGFCTPLRAVDYQPKPSALNLTALPDGQFAASQSGNLNDGDTLTAAAAQILENVARYVAVTQSKADLPREVDLHLSVDTGLALIGVGRPDWKWRHGQGERSINHLESWLGAQIEDVKNDLYLRMREASEEWLRDVADSYPGLAPSITVNGAVHVHATHPQHGRIALTDWMYEDLEENWPGLSDRVDELEAAFAGIKKRIGLPRLEVALEANDPAPQEDELLVM